MSHFFWFRGNSNSIFIIFTRSIKHIRCECIHVNTRDSMLNCILLCSNAFRCTACAILDFYTLRKMIWFVSHESNIFSSIYTVVYNRRARDVCTLHEIITDNSQYSWVNIHLCNAVAEFHICIVRNCLGIFQLLPVQMVEFLFETCQNVPSNLARFAF